MLYRSLLPLGILSLFCWACDDDDDDEPDAALIDANVDAAESDSASESDAESDAENDADTALCDSQEVFSLAGQPQSLIQNAPDNTKTFNPKTYWNNRDLAVQWVQPEDNKMAVWFGLFDRDGNPRQEPVRLGSAHSPMHEILYNGSEYISVWFSTASASDGYNGLQLRRIAADGTPAESTLNIGQTSDIIAFSAAQATFGDSMLLYSRGVNGIGGLYSRAIDPQNKIANPVLISEEASRTPAIVYGGEKWGATWLKPTTDSAEVEFQQLNASGQPIDSPTTLYSDASGNLRIAYSGDSNGVYGISGSRVPQTNPNLLLPYLTIVNGSGEMQAMNALTNSHPMPGHMLVTDITWLSTKGFGIAWEEHDESLNKVTVGFSRVSTSGNIDGSYKFAAEQPTLSALDIAGSASHIFGVYNADPNYSPSNPSDDNRVHIAILNENTP